MLHKRNNIICNDIFLCSKNNNKYVYTAYSSFQPLVKKIVIACWDHVKLRHLICSQNCDNEIIYIVSRTMKKLIVNVILKFKYWFWKSILFVLLPLRCALNITVNINNNEYLLYHLNTFFTHHTNKNLAYIHVSISF